jgi:uncharacterized protein with von Willebrand factor type A (vWA) domain
MESARTVVLGGVDVAAFATALSRRLRESGLDVGLTSTESFARALAAVPIGSPASLYWCARLTLVRAERDLAVFDRVFADVFDVATSDERIPSSRRLGRSRPESAGSLRHAGDSTAADASLPWATPSPAALSGGETGDGSPLRHEVAERWPSELDGIADEPFDRLDPADLARVTEWLSKAPAQWPTRRTRRMATSSRGNRVALRLTLERARRTGWEPVRLTMTRPVTRPRRLVLVCDVSQSMQAYTAAYLHVMRAAALGGWTESTRDHAEVFAFATRLTRLTAALRHRSTETAIELATELVTDRFGGTRIATNLTTLLRSRHGADLRGSVVVVASDGWDSDPPEELASAMRRLSRRAHRVVWLNPRAASASYEPKVGSMAAALPYCDIFLPAATLNGLRDALELLGDPAAEDGSERSGVRR